MASGEEEEKKKENYWRLFLCLVLVLLAGGGYYALTGMRQAAHKLAGGADYDQLSANSSIYDGGSGVAENGDYFPLDEEAARAQAVGGAKSDRVNSPLIRTREELVADASGKRPSQAVAVKEEEELFSAESSGAAPGGQVAMSEKLQIRASLSGGAAGTKDAKNPPSSSAGATGAFQGNGVVAGKASGQRETNAGIPKKSGRGSVVESLKSAFRASFYGARLSSQDSAKGWIAKSFDGTAEAATAIEYDDKMRSKLDKINPDAIPGFLREQDVSVAEAKRLTASDVAKPKMDIEGTKEALAADENYQNKKLANEFSGSMINGLFAGFSGA
ncbi:MAG: hypothetical protein AAB359_09765, partial [Elusimicrobiota bacterium]